ncbi:CDP-glycerol glycerophosphotransferase family protein [Alicyclobacillus sp. SO9]|nr:CDP-glycerol glycerophosphotransferase family protein [Alicyclobacillus sp. SO9]
MSVIVPLFNVEEFIETTLNGLLHQTLQEVEFLLIDDGSTDATYDIALKYAETHPRLKVIRQENNGPAAARNRGLKLARGQFICFVDSDDILVEDALENMYNAALEHDAQIVTGTTLRFNDKRTWSIPTYVRYSVQKPGLKHIDTNPELFYALGPCAKLYKKELVENLYFPEHIRLGEDQPFTLFAYTHAERIYTVDETVYYYRFREGQTKSLTQRALAEPQRVFDDLFNMMLAARDILHSNANLFGYYIRRVMQTDVLPRFRAALRSNDSDVQKAALHAIIGRVQALNRKDFSKAPFFHTYMILGTIYLSRYLKSENYGLAWKLIRTTFANMQIGNYGCFVQTVWPPAKNRVKRIMNKLKTRIENAVLRKLVFPVSKRFLPLRRHKVIFASNRNTRLEGNLDIIYHQVTEHYSAWTPLVYTKEQRSFREKFKQYYHLATAKLIVLDDYYYQLYGLHPRPDSDVVQTWHGCGAFKKFGLSASGSADSNSPEFERRAHSSYTKVITSSSSVVPHYAEAFGIDERKVMPLGVAKTDRLLNEDAVEKAKAEFFTEYPNLLGKKIILYAPTFRGKPAQRRGYKIQLNLEEMRDRLGDDFAVILKLHPMVQQSMSAFYDLGDFVVDLSSVSDITDLLMVADVLVTDYSSLVFDYSLLKRPIVFYAYDLDEYLSERGFYYDYRDFVPGPISTTTTELVDDILQERYSVERVQQFAQYFFEHQDGKSTERFLEYFLGPMPNQAKLVEEAEKPYVLAKTN